MAENTNISMTSQITTNLQSPTLQRPIIIQPEVIPALNDTPIDISPSKRVIATFTPGQDTREKDILDFNTNGNIIKIYTLTLDGNGKYVKCPSAMKENLRKYLSRYKLLTDTIIIMDPFIVNVGVDYGISIEDGFSKENVIFQTSQKIYEYFRGLDIGEAIILSDLQSVMKEVIGLKSIAYLRFKSKSGTNYSNTRYQFYDFYGVIPSPLEVSIFEIKYPNKDIQGVII